MNLLACNIKPVYAKQVTLLLLLWMAYLPCMAFMPIKNSSFSSGEKVIFNAYYNWGFIWLNAGEVSFETMDSVYNNHPAYFIKSLGKTHKKYDSFFKVRDTFEVFLQPDTLSTYAYHRATYEGPTNMQVWYEADFDSMQINARKIEPNKPMRYDTFNIHSNSYDVLTAIYAVRNFDFSNMKPGETIPFKLWVDMGYFDIYVRYRGIEDVKLRDGRKFNCLVFSPLLVEGTMFRDGEGMKVYVTNDENRVPVYIEAKILVGKVKAILKSTENLRHPVKAEIKK